MGSVDLETEQLVLEGSGGVRLTASRSGPAGAELVVLLHGGGQTRHAWRGTRKILNERGWQTVAIDLRGHGDSDRAPDGDYQLPAFARDIASALGQLGQPCHLIGASLGGLTALMLAGRPACDRVSSVALVDITIEYKNAGASRIHSFMRAHPDGFASIEDAAEAVRQYNPNRPPSRDLSGLQRNLRRGDDGRWRWHWDWEFVAGFRSFASGDYRPLLVEAGRAVQVPVLLVRGVLSDVVLDTGVARLLEVIPHAQTADVDRAGHMIVGDRNDSFADVIVGFLQGVPRT